MLFKNLKKPYIIAEIGINHEGSFESAKKLIIEAKKAGADAVKFQVFEPNTLAVDKSKKTKFQEKTAGKEKLSNIWKRVALSFTKLKKLRDISIKLNIDFICTPFDFQSLKLVKKLNLSAIKIASSDVTDIPLLSKISLLKRPVILSTGMSNLNEISKSLKTLKNKNIAILHCVSIYPCAFKNANLNRILTLKKKFKDFEIGYSDHCKSFEASIHALSLGAKVVEKHFTLNKNRKGLDHSLSADPTDLKIICDYAKSISLLPGERKIEPSKQEKKSKKFFRKGIYMIKDLGRNEIIKKEHIIIRRPANKVEPELYFKIIGKKSRRNLKKHDTINLKHLF